MYSETHKGAKILFEIVNVRIKERITDKNN